MTPEQINGTVTRKDGNADAEVEQVAEPWVNMFKKNRTAGNGMSLDYITPQYINGEIVVELEKEEVERKTEKWECALIVYAIGDCPG